jgi:ABC-2 type transport system permease protein
MLRLVRAEFLKLRTTQVWLWMLLADVAVGALVAIGSLAPDDAIKEPKDIPYLFATSNAALITAFVLSVLGITTEFRHQTITPTVLATPSRWAVVTAKMITYAGVGVAYGVACVGVQLAIALPWLSAKHIDVDFGDHDLQRAVFGMPGVFALFALFGIGLGALLRNQIVAVTFGLVFLLVLQNLIAAIPASQDAWAYTPAGATIAILYPYERAEPGDVQLLHASAGVLVLLLWALVPAVLGAAYSMNRDIT